LADPETGSEGQSVDSLVPELLSASSEGEGGRDLTNRIVLLPVDRALRAIAALGRSRQPAAAAVLAALDADDVGAPKALRKEARRELHRLRAVGVELPRAAPGRTAAPAGRASAQIVEVLATMPDGSGSRVISMIAERSLGGIYSVFMILSDTAGMKSGEVRDTTRKRYRERLDDWKEQLALPWAELPVSYTKQLIGEALDLNRESGTVVPRDFQVYRQALGDPVAPFERGLVYGEISSAEITFSPDLLEHSPSLLDEEEFLGWFFDPEEIRPFATELEQARRSQIVLAGTGQAERERRIQERALKAVMTPIARRGLKRRLEEAAYVLLRNDRPRQARLAVAAALPLGTETTSNHPFLQEMLERSFELLLPPAASSGPVDLSRLRSGDPGR
jgi:hypothetical protein